MKKLKNKSKIEYFKQLIFIVIFTMLFLNINIESNLIKDIMQNLLIFSSIFCAILITFIISKIFQIRNEKIGLQSEMKNKSNQFTNFRRICSKIINNGDIWDSKMKSKIENHYKHLTYEHFYNDFQKSKP